MNRCSNCNAALSVGASDCAHCGAACGPLIESQQPPLLVVVVGGLVLALFVSVASTTLVWFFPLTLPLFAWLGWLGGQISPRPGRVGLAAILLPATVALIRLLAMAQSHEFGAFPFVLGALHYSFFIVAALVASLSGNRSKSNLRG